MSRIWRYILAADNGMAPCFEDGMLSLCLCKPKIRAGAHPGDWVVAFVPKPIRYGHVAWAGRIAEVVPMGQFERRFSGRQDAIYRQLVAPWGEQADLIPLRDDYHANQKSRSSDLSGRNCLIFDPFWYWGGFGVPAPEEIVDLAHYFVGQSTTNSTPERIAFLEAWLRSVGRPGIHGEPRDRS